ncbi:MAG TPA: IS66 family transposase [Acidimicrobiales bacterium]|nr:IS66 family transposase [Acidimicrobiales bacterium]
MADQIFQLEARLSELMAENQTLRDRIAHLEAELNANSDNSSRPPSADSVKPRQSRAERRSAARAAGRRQGKQPGAPGANLARRTPDETLTHSPVCCTGCGSDLADAPVVATSCRQVLEIPEIRVKVTDHVVERRRCGCGQVSAGQFPPEARAPVCWGPEVRALAIYLMDRQHLPLERTAELLGELLDAPVSTGWLCSVQQEAAGKLAGFITTLKQRLANEPVVHADETGTRVGVTKAWVHTLASNLLTLLVVHPKRGVEALEDIGVLADYTGTVVHDGWAPYEVFEGATHAQCGAHLLRHLAAVGQTPAFASWCAQMTEILLAAKAASETAAGGGHPKVSVATAFGLRARYHATLDDAFALLPPGPPPRRRHKGGFDIHQRKAWNLASRLRGDADQVLRLLDDTRVPFDNNTAERALRMVKLHDKISGTFRSDAGAEAFATIRSYIQTAALDGHNRLDVLRQLFKTGAWLPAYPAGAT